MKILVVDDEELLVKGIRFNLQNDGYQVVTGSNGREAIELARDPDIRLIVLDVMMPEQSGLTFYGAVCRDEDWKRIPVVMLSALPHHPGIFGRPHYHAHCPHRGHGQAAWL